MKQIKMRKIGFDNLFNYILSVDFTENWEMLETADTSLNPLVIFRTKKWDKLENLIDMFLNKHEPYQYTDKTSEMDLVCGSFQVIKYEIKSITKLQKRNKIIGYMKRLGFTAKETFAFIVKFGINKGYEIITSEAEGK
tara:strand:- start:219 stop:632 length:414 start_codon:yes stop_codon:yes gene_type:complete